jgi:hypothetical protein
MTAIASDPPRQREERLLNVLGRAGRFRLSGGEQWLFVVGAAIVVGGLALILVAWVGTSRTVLVAGQIPYVVSGGLTGLGLIFLGGFLYFGHWQAALVKENRARADADRENLTLLRESIEELTTAIRISLTPTPGAAAVDVRTNGTSAQLVATANGSMMHRPDCVAVAGKNGIRAVTEADGLKACGICRPLVQDSFIQ